MDLTTESTMDTESTDRLLTSLSTSTGATLESTLEFQKDISPRHRAIIDVIESYRAWDLEKIMAWRTEDCITLIVPSRTALEPFYVPLSSNRGGLLRNE